MVFSKLNIRVRYNGSKDEKVPKHKAFRELERSQIAKLQLSGSVGNAK